MNCATLWPARSHATCVLIAVTTLLACSDQAGVSQQAHLRLDTHQQGLVKKELMTNHTPSQDVRALRIKQTKKLSPPQPNTHLKPNIYTTPNGIRFDVPSVSDALKHAVSQRLTLSWADTTKTLRFRAREAVLFDGQLEDGQYRWELTALPRAKTTSIASRMAQSVMDDAKRDALERQQIKDSPIHAFQRSASGVFTVAQGQVISSLIQEPQSPQNPHSRTPKGQNK